MAASVYISGPSIPLEVKFCDFLNYRANLWLLSAKFPWKQASQTHVPLQQQRLVRFVELGEQIETWRLFLVEIRQIYSSMEQK